MTKKEYLRQYRTAEQKCFDIDRRIQMLRSKYAARAIVYSDMPKSHSTEHDLSEYAAALDALERDLRAAYTEAINKQREIYLAVQADEDVRLRRILELRYVDGLTWGQIASLCHYDIRHVTRLHGQALDAFKIPMS